MLAHPFCFVFFSTICYILPDGASFFKIGEVYRPRPPPTFPPPYLPGSFCPMIRIDCVKTTVATATQAIIFWQWKSNGIAIARQTLRGCITHVNNNANLLKSLPKFQTIKFLRTIIVDQTVEVTLPANKIETRAVAGTLIGGRVYIRYIYFSITLLQQNMSHSRIRTNLIIEIRSTKCLKLCLDVKFRRIECNGPFAIWTKFSKILKW